MLLPTTVPTDAFSLEYLPEQNVLIGRWLRPVALAEAQAIYEALVAAALTQDCRHWLLDIRRRGMGDDSLFRWVGEVLTPRLATTFRQPVSIAYFAMVTHDAAATDTTLATNIQQGILQGTYYRYFNQEAECLQWLSQQP